MANPESGKSVYFYFFFFPSLPLTCLDLVFLQANTRRQAAGFLGDRERGKYR